MGTLYLGWDPKLERLIAIKTLTHDDHEFRERFSREARAAARLRHAHIITIYDVGEWDGHPYIAMEYCQGKNLEAVLRNPSALSIERKIALLEQLCDGLAFAHRAGIVHRDIKPANLMVNSEGQLKILDFGIARFTQSDGLTQAGAVIGTLNYMSPEQIQGQPVDHRSDIFSVGLVAYELLSGRQAFPGQLATGLVHRLLHEEPPSLARSLPSPLGDLAEIVARAMAKDPRDRYQALDDMRRELQRVQGRRLAAAWEPTELLAAPEATVLDGVKPLLGAGSPGEAVGNRSRSFSWLVPAALLVLLAALALVLLSRFERPEEAPVQQEKLPAESRTDPIEPSPADRPPPPESEQVPPDAHAVDTTVAPPADVGGQAPEPALARSLPRPQQSAPVLPPVCTRLLERLSLGETLTESEQRTLASKCRS